MRQKKFIKISAVAVGLAFMVMGSISCERSRNSHNLLSAHNPGTINLQFAQFDPVISSPSVPKAFRSIEYSGRDKRQYLVQFNGPVGDQQKQALLDSGGATRGYIPNNTFVVEAAPGAIAAIQASADVRWVGDMLPAYKVAPGLLDEKAFALGTAAKLRIQVYKTEDVLALSAKISAAGMKITRSENGLYHNYIKAEAADINSLASLAAMPEVEWIEPAPIYELLNDSSRWITQSYEQGRMPLWERGLSGVGQIVGIADGGVDADSCYFYDASQGLPTSTINPNQRKIIVYHDWTGTGKWDEGGHGTHTAGSIAGYNITNPVQPDLFNGMAFDAKLVVQDVFTTVWAGPNDISVLFDEAYWEGARIHSNSWSATNNYSYNTDSQSVDEFMWYNKDFLIVFSAGNAGPKGGTIQAPGTAKDLISAGATENAHTGYNPENVAYFSSVGPTMDSRIKPTIMAPGYYVNSAKGDNNIVSYNCDTQRMNGTSMSCPTISGVAALVRQYFTDGYYPSGTPDPNDGFTPSAALVKAMLINSARNMSGTFTTGMIPSGGQGWGEVKADDSLYFYGDTQTLSVVDDAVGLSTSQSKSFIYFLDGTSRFRATLVWTDYPAAANSWLALVNNLNLAVSGPSGSFLGNVFGGGQSIPGGATDSRNVEENVYLNNPVPGTYTLTVSAPNVPYGPQPFALVVTGAARCSGDGSVRLDKTVYALTDQVRIRLNDCGLNTDPNAREMIAVNISSDAEPGGETATLTEIDNNAGIFEGTINLAPGAPAANGQLEVSDGDIVTATYTDAAPPGVRTGTALVDGAAPVISGVAAHPDASHGTAAITWHTNENAGAKVYYGTTPALGLVAYDATPALDHIINLTGIASNTTYYFDVESADSVGNTRRDNNGGAHYTFNTSPPEIDVSPMIISVTTYQGGQVVRPLTIRNLGTGADLSFNISDSLGLGTLLEDTFFSSTLDLTKWVNNGAQVNYVGLNPPSPPLSLNLNGLDTISSMPFNTTGWSAVAYEYYYERQGAGVAPGPGNNLYFEWWSGTAWVLEKSHTYTDGSTTEFTKVTGILPAAASFNGLKVRFRTSGDPPYSDDWAIDDVLIYGPDATWLSEDPAQGSVAALQSTPVSVIFDARGVDPGSYKANILIANNDSDENPTVVPVYLNVTAAPDISFNSVIQDDNASGRSSGNGNGLIEPFEVVELWVTIQNMGNADATGVSGALSCDDSRITILDSSDAFGDIPQYSTATGMGAFLVTASPLIPDGTTIPLDLLISDGSHQWQATFPVQITNKSFISGQVTRAGSGAPLANATIHYTGPATGTVTTGPTGNYVISNLTSGVYTLRVTAPGMMDSAETNVTLPPSVAGINFVLQSTTAISGAVTRASDGTPVLGATVNYAGPEFGTATTDASGNYSIPDLLEGTYVVRASAAGLTPSTPATVVLPPTATGLNFSLSGMNSISGTVIDQNTSLPIVGAMVAYTGPSSGSVKTAAGGAFSLTQLKAGKYTLRAVASLYNPSGSVTVTVPPNASGVTISLVPYSTISGMVINQVTGLPVVGATVYCSGPTNGSVASGAGGLFTFSQRPAGTYTVYAYKSGYNYSVPMYITTPPDAAGLVLALLPPKISVSPSSVSVTLPPDVTDHRYVQVSNLGSSTLSFTASAGGLDDDLECGTGAWTHAGNPNSWQLGSPSLVGPSAAHSGTKLWGTNLSGNYGDDAASYLVSPPIDIRKFTSATLSFWHWFEFEPKFDYGHVQASTDPLFNNSVTLLASFTGYQGTWMPVSLNLSAFAGKIIYLRFLVITDESVNMSGWYIDDIRVYDPARTDWITVSPHCGTVSPAGIKALDLGISTTDLADGPYSVNLTINSNDPATASVTVPVNLTVTTGTPHISVLSHTVIDDNSGASSGNGNGWPEAGETVVLPITIQNDGLFDITGVSAVMTSADPYVSIPVNSQNFGDVAAGDQATGLPGFAVHLDPAFPYGHVAPLLILFTDGVHNWQGLINLSADPVPDMSVSPSSLLATARELAAAPIVKNFSISNTGRAWLTFNTHTTGGVGPVTVFRDDMESGTGSWSHSVVSGSLADKWALSTARSHSGTRSWTGGKDQNATGSTALATPNISLQALSSATLTFYHWFQFDDCGNPFFEPDGGIVEISTDAGSTWNEIYPLGSYPYVINDNQCGNNFSPILNKDAYAHSSNAWEFQTFDLNPYLGKTIRLRFRAGWDCAYCKITDGWYVDDVSVQGTSTTLPWLTLLPGSGMVAPFGNQTVGASFNPVNLAVGTHTGAIVIDSNDPDMPSTSVKVTFVIQPSPKLVLSSYIADDDAVGQSSGNGNGVVEPGESIELKVELANNGQVAAGSITGTLSSATPGVSVIAPNDSWNDLPPGTSGMNLSAFVFQVDPAFAGDSATLNLAVTSASTGDVFQITIDIPILRVPDIVVNPPSVSASAMEGENTAQTISIDNRGSAVLHAFLNESPASAWFDYSPPVFDVAPGLSQTVQLAFDASALGPGSYNLDLVVFSNDQDDPFISVPVTLVVLPASNLTVSGMTIDDDNIGLSLGDADGHAEAGEHVEIGISLKNAGALDAPGALATLTSLDNRAVVLVNQSNYGDIASGATVTRFDLAIKLDTAIPDGTMLPFDLDVATTDGRVSHLHFVLTITGNNEVTGHITETSSGAPIGGATIAWSSSGAFGVATSAPDGSYTISNLPSGSYTLAVSRSGYVSKNVPLVFPPDHRVLDITLDGPVANVTPASLVVSVSMNGSRQAIGKIAIADQGAAALDYSVALFDDSITALGGPDAFGYRFYDASSANGPVPGFVDISASGTPVSGMGDDANVGPINIGFAFPFYGQTFTSLYICSNGWISFTDTSTAFANRALPDPLAPKNLIAPFWTDLNPALGGQILYRSDPSGMVIEFLDVPGRTGSGPYTFEIILTPSGIIRFEYLTTLSPTTVTAGIQNATGTDGLTVVDRQPYITDNAVVLIAPGVIWMDATPDSGSVASGTSDTLTVSFDARGINLSATEYHGRVVITNNDPQHTPWTVPVTMTLFNSPSVPVPIDPPNGGQVAVASPTLSAGLATDPDPGSVLKYYFKVCSDSAMTQTVDTSMGIDPDATDVSWTLSAVLNDLQTYYWQVWAVDEHGLAGDPSATQSFLVSLGGSAPTGVEPVSPQGGVVLGVTQPTLIVTNGTDPRGGTLTYDFEIYSDAQLTALLAQGTGIAQGATQTSWTVTQPLAAGVTYYWRARAYNGTLYSAWSTAAIFIIGSTSTTPPGYIYQQLVTPSSGGGGGKGGCVISSNANDALGLGDALFAILVVGLISFALRRKIMRRL